MDDRSRYLLGARAQQGTDLRTTRAAFVRLFRRYGLPERIRSDNGTPFASRATAGLYDCRSGGSSLASIRAYSARPTPAQRPPRAHASHAQTAYRPPARYSMAAQQRCFDDFQHAYNDERPHQALAMTAPASLRGVTPTYPGRPPDIEYPGYFEVRRVTRSGLYRQPRRICLAPSRRSRHRARADRRESMGRVFQFLPLGSDQSAQASGRLLPRSGVTHVHVHMCYRCI